MAANTDAIYPIAPHAWHAHLSAANTARDGSGTLVTLADGATNGARVDRVEIKAQGNTAAGVIRFWIVDGGAARLLTEFPVTISSPVASGVTFSKEWVRSDGQPLALLGPAQLLKVTSHVANAFDVVAFGGLY